MIGTVRTSASLRREKFVLWAALAFFTATIVSAPMRWIFAQAGLTPLIYLPNAALLTATIWHTVAEVPAGEYSLQRFGGLAVIAGGLAIGLALLPPKQVALGAYALLPFWFGLACGPLLLRAWRVIAPLLWPFWLICLGGVITNSLVDYPWEGFAYSVGDVDVEGAREWYATGGGKRIAGLARASFDAGVHVLILSLLLAIETRSRLVAIAVWALGAYAVVLTTSKGVLIVFLVLTPYVAARRWIPEPALRALPVVIGGIGMLLPLAALLFDVRFDVRDEALANITFSFVDRLQNMWPEAWLLLHEHGHMLFGRGIGGIGTAQTYFEPGRFNAADNLFMYWWVVFGWAIFPLFLGTLLRSVLLRPHHDATDRRVYVLWLAALTYGMTTNIVENAMFAAFCGLAIRHVLARPAGWPPPQPAQA